MKRILHILPSLELGGTEAFIMNHYKVIDRNKIQFDFLVFAEGTWPYLKEIEDLGGRFFYASQPSLLHIPQFYREFKKAIAAGGPYEAIHCHADAGNAVPLLCGALCNINCRISHAHSISRMPENFLFRAVLLLRKAIIRMTATSYLACSCDAGKSLYGRVYFQKHGKIIRNGIPVKKFSKTSSEKAVVLKKEFRVPETDSLIVGNISRFDTNKNQIFAINVFKHLLEARPNAVLLLGGVDGGNLRNVQEEVWNLGLSDHVRFIGKRNDVSDCLNLIDVYLLPSVQEGLSMALVEAQAAGCLCFASTGVPRESDMGLGNVFYLDLSKGAEYWSRIICERLKQRILPAAEEVYELLYRNGFEIARSTEELVKCYE